MSRPEALEAVNGPASLIIDGDLKDDLAGFRSVLDFGSGRNFVAGDCFPPCGPLYLDCAIGVVMDGEICHCNQIFLYLQRYRLPIYRKS